MDPVAALRTPTRTDSHQDTQPIIFTSALLSLIFNKPMRPRANKQADRDAGAWGPVRFRNVYPAGPCPIASSASSSLPKIVAPSTIYLFAQLIYNARKIHIPDMRACGVSRRSMRIIIHASVVMIFVIKRTILQSWMRIRDQDYGYTSLYIRDHLLFRRYRFGRFFVHIWG